MDDSRFITFVSFAFVTPLFIGSAIQFHFDKCIKQQEIYHSQLFDLMAIEHSSAEFAWVG